MRRWIYESSKNYEYINLGKYRAGVSFRALKYDDGRVYICSNHPYDESDYHWAFSKDDKIFTIYIGSPGRKVKTFVSNEDREYNDVVEELIYLDRHIKPNIMHN